MNIYSLLDLKFKKIGRNKMKIKNRKKNFVFWNFKNKKEWKNRG